tara:strand:+ start:412 stop:792 length:381 start_codon:yes stop_codon:yes gene_type:complete
MSSSQKINNMKRILSLLTVFALIGCNDSNEEIYECMLEYQNQKGEMKLVFNKSSFNGTYNVTSNFDVIASGSFTFSVWPSSSSSGGPIYAILVADGYGDQGTLYLDTYSRILTEKGEDFQFPCSLK